MSLGPYPSEVQEDLISYYFHKQTKAGSSMANPAFIVSFENFHSAIPNIRDFLLFSAVITIREKFPGMI
jgi:hypothetical protein